MRRTLVLPGWPSALYPAALLLAVLLPFEAIQPVISLSWLSLSDEKLILLVVAAAWLIQGSRALPTPDEWRALLPSLVFLLVSLISARVAAINADEATRYVARLAAGAFALLVALRLARTETRITGLLWAIVVGGGASALLGVGEALRWPLFDPLLGLFKVAPTRVGGELRVGASFQYATIAAMYFEMVVPLAIVLAARAERRFLQVLATSSAMLCAADVVLSLTRAGMLTLAVILALVLLAATLRSSWRKLVLPAGASAAVLVGGVALLLLRDPVFDLRLVTESDADWYGAVYSAPTALSAHANQSMTVALDVRNEGRITWATTGIHPFALGYRWLTADGTGVLDLPSAEVGLPRDVEPGDTVQLQAVVAVPELPNGAYRLDWGMLQRDVLQFYERGWADAETSVQVANDAPAFTPLVTPRDDSEAPWVVGRLELWSAAARLFVAHPLVGVGPDNFRHLYGAELGLEAWDERVQANNVYLELLADLGVVGLAAFAWLVAAPTKRLFERLRNARADYVYLGVALAVAAFLLHGLLDSFLAFTPTALLFWLLLGVTSAIAQKPQVSGR